MADDSTGRRPPSPAAGEANAGEDRHAGSAVTSGGMMDSRGRGDGAEHDVDVSETRDEEPRAESSESNDQRQSTEKAEKQEPQSTDKKPSKVKQLWEKSGLDVPTLSMMFKGSLPPIIALAMYQSRPVAETYTTLGYLVAITSILGFCIMPRGKFIQTMSLNILAICFAAAINLLALYSVVRARAHTTSSAAAAAAAQSGSVPYNSSASAVCAIWLFAQTYVVNTIRAARPQYQFPCIIYSIFLVVSLTYGVMFPSMASAISFMERLLEAFLTGFALATATHFLVFPTSSRKVVFKMMGGYLQLLNGLVKTQTAYMGSLAAVDPVQLRKKNEHDAEEKVKKSQGKKSALPENPFANPASQKLRELYSKMLELHTKLHGDITPAKREIAIGKLESHDITELWGLLRLIFVPVMGLCSMMTIFERQAELRGWGRDDLTGEDEESRVRQLDNLHFLMRTLHKPFQLMAANLDGAFNHIMLTLEFVKPTKKSKNNDVESKAGDGPAPPGSPGFAEAYKQQLDDFYHSKQKTLQAWCSDHDIDLPDNFFESSFVQPEKVALTDEHVRERDQRNLFLTLYLEYLIYRVGKAVLDLVLFVDKRKQEGAFDNFKVIFPGSKTLYDWLKAVVGREDVSQEDSYTADMDSGGSQTTYLGQEFEKRKDPEHEPPRNALERFGGLVRGIPEFFRSDASAFGFRAAAATMSIGIICYLHQTQAFFLTNRLLWAMIMVAISMTRTAGQSIFNFALRILGTAVAMVGSYIIWYIVVGHIGGVLVFLWLWIFCSFYVVIKIPKLLVVGILSLVTCVLTVGYELQVDEIGVQAAESNGQPAYPMYILAPYRLATVTAGIFVAFVWTVFPYPVSESTELRKDLGATMYLMGLYYHLGHETIKSALHDIGGNVKVKGTHANHLEAARRTVFSKLVFLMNTLSTNSAFSKYQIPIGGRFPREEYESLIACLRRLLLWISLANYASSTFQPSSDEAPGRTQWSQDFRKIIASVNVSSHRITTILSVLSSSMRNAAPLPPHLELPEPFSFAKKMESLDADILSVRHMVEPEYSAFAVMQVVSKNIVLDIEQLAKHVRNLVGEIDFSFHAIKPSSIDSDVDSLESDNLKKE